MTPRDFCYWLQGYFELDGSNWNSPDVLEIVLKHLELVKATPGDYDSNMISFLGWLESAIEFEASQEKVQEKLSSIFEHVIDKNTPGNSYLQNQIHNPDNTMRC